MDNIISNQEPKGTSDWLPAELNIRRYIFETWRTVCCRYGYEEYLTPLVESADIYRAKSGEDVGGRELVTFTDLGGRELSIRPEMTPSVTRLVSKIYAASPKPIRFFSIANFMRNEKPQRGRNREFWQLNCDLFGSAAPAADLEILQLALDIMLEFDPPQDSFVLYFSDRRLIDGVLSLCGAAKLEAAAKAAVVRTLDKWDKLPAEELERRLREAGLSGEGADVLKAFMKRQSVPALLQALPALADNPGLRHVQDLADKLDALGYGDYLEFNPGIIRGFDYYDGLVFEVFDRHPENNRAMFGGGRYNGLARIFGAVDFPAVGFAPGDETIRLFLESWGLLADLPVRDAKLLYLPLLDEALADATGRLARELRAQGRNVVVGLESQKLGKALEYANKRGVAATVIYGTEEAAKGVYKVKDMADGSERQFEV